MRSVILAGVLFSSDFVCAVELTKLATVPKGHNNFYQLPVGDLDHDGLQDLVFEQSNIPFSTNIWEHWGSNSQQPVNILSEGCGPVVGGDPDQDGLSDLLCVWSDGVFLLESVTPTAFPSRIVWQEPPGGFPGIRGYFEDTDQDGQQEMWIVPNDPDWIEVWENRGNDTYVRVGVLTDPLMNPETLAFGDFDGDGATEIVVGSPYRIPFVWETGGNDVWNPIWTYEFPLNWSSSIVAAAKDLDGDGRPEFLVGTDIAVAGGMVVTIFEAAGDNSYDLVWQLQEPESFVLTHIVVGDVDGEPQEEFAVEVPGAIEIYEAAGDNQFVLAGEVPYLPSVGLFSGSALALADLNGNGVDELIVTTTLDQVYDPTEIHIYELADVQPSVLIPAWYPESYQPPPGSKLSVHLEVFNRTDLVQPQDLWLEVYQSTGQGGPKGPLLVQKLLRSQAPLPARRSASRKLNLRAPPVAAEYTY